MARGVIVTQPPRPQAQVQSAPRTAPSLAQGGLQHGVASSGVSVHVPLVLPFRLPGALGTSDDLPTGSPATWVICMCGSAPAAASRRPYRNLSRPANASCCVLLPGPARRRACLDRGFARQRARLTVDPLECEAKLHSIEILKRYPGAANGAWCLSRRRMSVATRQAAALAEEEMGRRRNPSSRQSSEAHKSPARRAAGSCAPSTALHHVLLLG